MATRTPKTTEDSTKLAQHIHRFCGGNGPPTSEYVLAECHHSDWDFAFIRDVLVTLGGNNTDAMTTLKRFARVTTRLVLCRPVTFISVWVCYGLVPSPLSVDIRIARAYAVTSDVEDGLIDFELGRRAMDALGFALHVIEDDEEDDRGPPTIPAGATMDTAPMHTETTSMAAVPVVT